MKDFESNGGKVDVTSSKWDSLAIRNRDIGDLNDAEMLKSESAESILPYLTLKQLSDHEKAELLKLAKDATDAATNGRNGLNVIDFNQLLEDKVAVTVGKDEDWKNGQIPSKLSEARKLFCASVFDDYNKIDDVHDKDLIRSSFFAMSPNISSYCGGLKDSLEMLCIAERVGRSGCTNSLYGEIIYDSAFDDGNAFDDILKQASSLEQLQLLPVIYDVSRRCASDSWEGGCLNKISMAFDNLEKNKESAPLSRVIADGMGKQIDRRIHAEWADLDMNNPESIEIINQYEQRKAKIKAEQMKLHQEFPELPSDQWLTKIAPDVMGSFPGGRLDVIADKSGNRASLLDYTKENGFGIDKNTATLIGMAHKPEVKETIDAELGLDLAEVPLDSQIQLLKFMAEAGDDRYDRLCEGLHKVDEQVRLKLAEGFLATDFGEDFGDALLEIAESKRISGEQLEEILDSVESCRESIHGITGLYEGFDKQFAGSYARATNERLTDAIVAFQQIARSGVAEADLGWFGGAEFSYDEAIEALELEAKSLGIINGTLHDVNTGKRGAFAERVLRPEYYSQFSLYNFYSPEHGYVLLYTRPEGSGTFDETIEYGKYRSKYDERNNNAGVEASISMIVNPVDPFSLPKPYKPDRRAVKNPHFYDPSTMDKVSAIRLDREGRAPGAPADDPERNPMNKVGTISVDLAAINDRADTPSGKIARLFSVGNKIRGDVTGVDSALNHNTHWFDQGRYGTADGFKELVKHIDTLANEWCAKRKPGRDSESFRKLLREFGQRARRAA